jgi:hypothetical protein
MLKFFMLYIFMLSVIMLSVILLNAIAPFLDWIRKSVGQILQSRHVGFSSRPLDGSPSFRRKPFD